MKFGLLLAFVAFTGCLGDQQNRLADTVVQKAPEPAVITKENPGTENAIRELRTETTSSNNATQNSITGLGVQVSKVAEKIQGVGGDLAHLEGDLVHLETNVKAQVDAQANVDAQFRVSLSNEIQASLKVQAQANAEAIANLHIKLDALVQVQTGLNNKIEQMTTSVSSGRDSIVKITQFSDQMVQTLKDDNRTLIQIVLILSGLTHSVVIILAHQSRSRAESRATAEKQEKHKLLEHFLKGVKLDEKAPS